MSAEAKDKTEHLTYKLTSVEMTTPCDGTYSFADATAGVGSWEIDNKSSKEYSYADALPSHSLRQVLRSLVLPTGIYCLLPMARFYSRSDIVYSRTAR